MKLLIMCGMFAWTHAASLNSEKRANGDVGCLYNGVFEYIGSRFSSLDGCNACQCTVTGVACSSTTCRNPGTVNCLNAVNNHVIQNGQSYTAADGCNTCACNNGNIICTQRTCTTVPVNLGANCVSGGKTYQNSHTFTAADGCNTCTCNNGVIACTHITCPGTVNPGGNKNCVNANNQAYQHGQSYTAPDGCNTCSCNNGKITCSQLTCQPGGTGLHIGVGLHPGGGIHTGVTCYDNVQHLFHNDGETYTHNVGAGCSTCTCSAGILTCGQCNTGGTRTCVDLATNNVYSNGQTVRATDGCNTCTCSNGQFTCTTLVCTPVG